MTEQQIHDRAIHSAKQGRHEDAVTYFRQLVDLQPSQPVYLSNLALSLAKLGRTPEAIATYRAAISLRPGHAPTLAKLGRALADSGELEEALATFRRAISSNPTDPDVWNALGAAYANAGRMSDAHGAFERAVELDPSYDEARDNLVLACTKLGEEALRDARWEPATKLWKRVTALAAQSFEAHYNLGLAYTGLKKLAEAEASYRLALQIRPGEPKALNNLAHVLLAEGNPDAALECLHRALEADPEYVDALYNLGVILQNLERPEEAMASYLRLVMQAPNHADAHNNIGSLLLGRADPSSAITHFDRALHEKPDHTDARWNRGLAKLSLGDFEGGWADYESRLTQLPYRAPSHKAPRWTGQALEGKTVQVWAEQGLGDTIQFVRFVPNLVAAGAKVHIECQERLFPLISLYTDIGDVYSRGDAMPDPDYQIPLLSLPAVLKTTAGTIPRPLPAPEIPEAKRNRWSKALAALTGIKAGLCWGGHPGNEKGWRRSAPLLSWLPILGSKGVSFVSLQRGPQAQDLEHLPEEISIACPEDESNDIVDTAAIVSQVDLVITVDTMIAHLAGSLGKPTWVLLPYAADWRWMLGRADSPWYPSARLFRQNSPGDWTELADRVAAALVAFA